MSEQFRTTRVKDKTIAAVQITAEQILREASDRPDGFKKVPKNRIADVEELHQLQGTRRQQFEDSIRKDRTNVGTWIKYAAFEESQYEFERYY